MAKKKTKRKTGSNSKPKPKEKTNKSAAIRDYITAHPDENNADVASVMQGRGLDVTPQYVCTIRANARRAAEQPPSKGKLKRSVPKRAASRRAGRNADMVSLGTLAGARDLVQQAGGIREAKAAIDSLAKLLD